jgi:hypothetical protein
MYNLTVAQAHTFFVGDGQWLVHNADWCRILPRPSASEPRVQNIINDIYKHVGEPNQKGDGTTFAVLSDEVRNNMPVVKGVHYQKAADHQRGLRNIIDEVPQLSSDDQDIVLQLLETYEQAWKGLYPHR